MKNQSVNYQIQSPSSAEESMIGISKVNEWWAKNLSGTSHGLNSKFSVHFGETRVAFKISEWVPNKKIVWKVEDCYLHWIDNKTEWNGTEVIWEIKEKDGGSEISFTHLGLIPEVECYNDCRKGWSQHVNGSLKNLLTNKVGQPE